MLQVKAPHITRYDYQEMPPGPPYYQVIEGDLVMSPSPNTFHQHIAGNIYFLLRQHLSENSIGEVFMAPLDVFLSDINVYQPDVIFVSNERRAIITDHGIEGAPDLLVEALSPATARYDKGSKRKIYARTGVKELWLVNPEARTLQVYLLAKDSETPSATHRANATFTSSLLPGLKIKTATILKSLIRG
jgi:Uma2 family endonuclease